MHAASSRGKEGLVAICIAIYSDRVMPPDTRILSWMTNLQRLGSLRGLGFQYELVDMKDKYIRIYHTATKIYDHKYLFSSIKFFRNDLDSSVAL